jgi:hypothetical protein
MPKGIGICNFFRKIINRVKMMKEYRVKEFGLNLDEDQLRKLLNTAAENGFSYRDQIKTNLGIIIILEREITGE